MKYALIGCGRIAANHMKAALENELSITAVCDVVPTHMEKLLASYALQDNTDILRFTDHRDLLAQEQPELVAISTESGKHAAIALDCIAAGAHVIIEKPIALSLADADAIIAAGKKNGVFVCACHQNRFNQSVQYMRRALEAGRFGQLSHGCVHVRWNRNAQYYTQAPWRGTWEQDGGALMNQSIHGIDLLRWMMGDEIEEVFAYTSQRFHLYLEAEDVGLAVVKFHNGALGTIEGTTNIFPQNLEETVYLFGETGTVKLGGKSANAVDVWQFADQQVQDALLQEGFKENTSNVYGNGHTPLYADMVAAIRDGRDPYVDGEAGRRALELVLAIYRSAKERRPVALPMEGDFSTMDMQDYTFNR